MTKAYLGSVELPLDFKYSYEYRKRLDIDETLTADVVQTRPYYDGDTRIRFDCSYVPADIADAFRTAYMSGSTVTFVDYDEQSSNVILIEWREEEVAGMFNISGLMKVVV